MKRQMLAAAIWLAGSSAILIAGATLLCPNSQCRMPWIDTALLALLNDWRSIGLDTFFAAITWLGSLSILLPLAVLIAWAQSLAPHQSSCWLEFRTSTCRYIFRLTLFSESSQRSAASWLRGN